MICPGVWKLGDWDTEAQGGRYEKAQRRKLGEYHSASLSEKEKEGRESGLFPSFLMKE